MPVEILTYERLPAVCLPWDPRSPEVAALLARAIREANPEVRVEHIGSSSIPGCDGKGVIDLLVIYPDGGLERARDALDAMGFQRQVGPDPWPEERPMRVGAVDYDGARFRIHAHVVHERSDETHNDLRFRDNLRARPALVAAYVAEKRRVISSGVTDSVDYAYAKGDHIQALLGSWDGIG